MRRPAIPRNIRNVQPKKRGALVSLIISAILVATTAGFSIAEFSNRLVTTVDENLAITESGLNPEIDAFEDGELNVLLLGSDSRAEEESSEDQRSDTMILVHIPETHDRMYVMSIMRDLWVEIPGYGSGKINGALELGGYPLVIDTVQNLIDIDIDHLAIIDFEGFSDLTTALGGVEVDNEIAFSAGQVNPSYYPAGEIKLQGTDALRYVRERKSFIDGDYQRVRNQQKFLAAIVSQLLRSDTLSSPDTISSVVTSFSPYLTVDEGLDAQTMISYGLALNRIRSSDIKMFTLPNGGVGTTTGGASVIWTDEAAMAEMRQAMNNGTLDDFIATLEQEEEQETGEDALLPEGETPAEG